MEDLLGILTDDEDMLELLGVVDEGFRRNPRVFRERVNHFDRWTEEEFFDRFRLTKDTVRQILEQINIAPPTNRNSALSAEDMLLLTLRYFATGSMLIVVGDFCGIHKSTASRIVYKVARAIAQLRPQYIHLPETEEEIIRVRLGFYRIASFPRCIGAVDCTHVKIQSPGGDDAELYRNRKGYFSMNVQCICDASLKISSIVCRWPGSTHDSTIFNMSRVRATFEHGEMGDSLLVGDSGYGIKRYLITPLGDPRTPEEHLFNESQIRTRNPIERCFGVWKRRFPILALGIRLEIQKVEAVVVATAVLHNIACENADPAPPLLDEETEALIEDMNNIEVVPRVQNNDNINNAIRHALITDYFANLL